MPAYQDEVWELIKTNHYAEIVIVKDRARYVKLGVYQSKSRENVGRSLVGGSPWGRLKVTETPLSEHRVKIRFEFILEPVRAQDL